MASSSSSSPSVLKDLVEAKQPVSEEGKQVKEVVIGANYKISPSLLFPFKSSCTSQEEEETCLFELLKENSKYYGGARIIRTSSSSLIMTLIPPSISIDMPPAAATPQAKEDRKGDENLSTEIKATADGQQHLKEKKRDGQDNMSDVQTSTKRRRTSTTYVFGEEEDKGQQRNEDLADSSKLKETVAEEKSGVPTARSADSALDISLRSESLVSPAFREDYDANKEKSTMPPIIDYATALIDHKYNAFGSPHINMFEAADLLKCIANVHPVDQRSELERETGMFCRDWLTHPRDPSVWYLDIYLSPFRDKDMEKVYLSDIYVQVQKLVQAFDENTVEKLKHFIDMLPMTKEVFNYEMNWAVVDKYELHEKTRPWISNIAKNSMEEEADDFVSDVLESIKKDGSALSIHTKIMSFILVNEVETERLFPKIWAMLKKLEEGASRVPSVASHVPSVGQGPDDVGKSNCAGNGMKEKIRDSGNRHEFLSFSKPVDGDKPVLGVESFNGTPITKEKLLSLEINWAVFDQHELHETMKLRIKNEVMKLLKKEKASVVDQVIDGIKKQNRPSQMLELLEPSLDDYTEMVVRILWRTLLILVKIFETAFPESISSANPTSELSNMEGKTFMPSKDNLRQQDPVWNNKENSDRVGSVIKRNRGYSYPSFWLQKKMLDFKMLCEGNRLANAIPRNVESVSSYVVDWAVSDKEELHKKLRPWIAREIREFVRQEEAATGVVNNIVSRIQEHASAKDILELVKPSLGNRSANFVLHLWTQLLFFIQLAGTTGLDPFVAIDRERSAGESMKLPQYGDRYSRNRHFMMVAFDYENLLKLKRVSEAMPKTKEELCSYEINWDVYEKHGLQKSMRKGIWAETLELIRQRKECMLVDEQIMWSIFEYHVSASQREFSAQEEAIVVFEGIMSRLHKDGACPSEMVKYLEPIFGSGSENFVMRMWYALVCGVKLAEARVEKKCKRGWGSIVLLPAQDEVF